MACCFTNGELNLKCGKIQTKYNIRRIDPYKPDTNVEDINPVNKYGDVKILITSYILLYF